VGKRGRKRMPKAVLELHGSWRAKSRINEPEPAPEDSGAPDRPEWLAAHKHAVALWDYNVPRLERMGVLTTVDRDALGRYCVLMSMWIEASEYVALHGPLVEETYATDTGMGSRFTDHPAVARLVRLDQQLQKLGGRFCLTAGDRANMSQHVSKRGQAKTREEELAEKYGS
jgi:P27 family predicted phage terminase small subunit